MRSLSLLGLSTVLAALAIYVWRARSENPVNRWFAFFTFVLGGWVLGIAGVESNRFTDFWGRLTFVSASFIPVAFLGFSRWFPTHSSWPPRAVIIIGLTLATGWGILSAATSLVAYDISRTTHGIQRNSGPLYPAFTGYFLLGSLVPLGVFLLRWRRMRGLPRAQLQYLAIGLLIITAGGLTTNLLIPAWTGKSTYSWLGPYFALPLVILVGHSIIRHRLMDLRLVIHRSLVYLAATALLSVLAIGILRLSIFPPDSDITVPADILIVGIVGLLMLSVPATALLTKLVDPYLFRGRVDYVSGIRDATHRLSRLMPPAELAAEIRSVLDAVFVPETFYVAARSVDENKWETLLGAEKLDESIFVDATLLVDQPTPSAMLINPSREFGTKRVIHNALRKVGVEVAVILGRRSQALGAILLGPRRSGDPYFTRDLAYIESVAELASVALENSLLHQQRIRALEYSNRLLESLNSAVVAVNNTGQITSFNYAARALFDLDDTSRGASLDLLPTEIGWGLALAICTQWCPRDVEASIDDESGGPLPIVLSTAVLHDEGNNVAGALVVVTDLSTIKALERHQRRIEHLATMARFYAGIAHEIRSPLGAISNFISMLPDRFDDPEYRDTAARLLPLEVARIVRLADRLRLMAPSESGKLTPVSLAPLLADIVAIHAPAAEEQNVRLQIKCGAELPEILGDRAQLTQLFVNVIRNAIESMPSAGIVTITALAREGGRARSRVIVRVTDQGTGIDPDVRSRIFEPFFTTKPSGTGLGLSICQEIADFHRAHFSLTPRIEGRGTVAQVDFPAISEEFRHEPVVVSQTGLPEYR